ncbi:hypothetical protein BJ878DRAFT_577364 [Calycina marina]|uniref:Uncharacterized protein n=1 Tax=Calycina marina TaxID=1763456 RepID=A0A9P7YZI3_9HELO|nr:hypothetical protein BJ878DRAFT_577364 [Calycina marina]
MGPSTWPKLGPSPDSFEKHASKLKEEINGFKSDSAYDRDSTPAGTYRIMRSSISALNDKILKQPTANQLYGSMENVRIPLQGVQNTASETHDSIQQIQKTTTSISFTADRISTTTKTYASAASSCTSILLKQIRIRLHSQTTAEAFRVFSATRLKIHIQEAIYKSADLRMKKIEVTAANQLKSGDLAISTASPQDAAILRENVKDWDKEVAEGAEVQIPVYTIAVHGIYSKSIELNKIEEAKQGIILANIRTVPCNLKDIRRMSWIFRAHEVKAKSSIIIIEFTNPHTANAFIENGMVYQDQLHDCEQYSPESKGQQRKRAKDMCKL